MGKEEPKALKRALGLWSATAINVGAIIGGGIFVVTGIVAGLAGSALVVSMVVAGIIAVFTALSFAELTAWQPVEGSVYEYTCQLVSPFSGFLAGWMWMLSNTFAGAAVSLGFAYYFSGVFPVLPAGMVAAVLCLVFAAVNFVGIKQSTFFNNFLVVVKLAVLGFLWFSVCSLLIRPISCLFRPSVAACFMALFSFSSLTVGSAESRLWQKKSRMRSGLCRRRFCCLWRFPRLFTFLWVWWRLGLRVQLCLR